ncbi:MAG: hypothetical protein Q7K35_00195 [bacterium]|nr:hypothetical protein [bacterium]
MLVLKKLSTKKLTIYIFIIALMLGSIGFVLYKNRGSSDSAPAAVESPAPGASSLEPANPEVSKVKNIKGLDLTIFSSKKYNELRENILGPQENLDLGKRDPFKPN